MLPKSRFALLAVLGAVLLAAPVFAADLASNLKPGTPDLKSAGALAFGPEGILFVGDSTGGAIFALATDDTTKAGAGHLKVEGLGEKIAALLGTTAKDVTINDLAVNPASGNAYVSVARGTGPSALPVILKIARDGKITEVSLKNVKFAKADLGAAPAATGTARQGSADAITDLAYLDGRVFVAGLSNEEFRSRLRSIPFPFQAADKGAGIEIYHGAHGKFETASPVRTFTVYKIGGEDHLLAAYTCTPLVKIPVKDLKAGANVKGTTIAELGNRNRPLDMIVYKKDGKDFILLTNNSRGVMKITTENIDKQEGITEPVRGGGTKGITYETIEKLKGVQQLDKLDDQHALVIVQTEGGALNLETIHMP